MPKRALSFALACLAATTWVSCHPAPSPEMLRRCGYEFQSFRLARVDSANSYWEVGLKITNPNPKEVVLNRMDFRLLHGGDTLAMGRNPVKCAIPPDSARLVAAELALPLGAWRRLPPDLLAQEDARFTLRADAYVDTWLGPIRVPGAIDQELHVNMPAQWARFRGYVEDVLMRYLLQSLIPGS